MTFDEILRSLNPEQAAAVATREGPVLVLAGAGTGKTRVITYRIAGLLVSGVAPENILGLTFTNKAAREMRERLARLVDGPTAAAVTLGTFHAFCVRLLRKEAHRLGYLPGFTVADDSDQQGLIKQAIAQQGLTGSGIGIPAVLSMIGSWKNRLLTPRDARNQANNDFEITVGTLYGEYQSMLENQNMIDFDDMLLLTCRLFREFPEVLEQYRERYRYLLVDEYQDTNGAQFALVQMLAGERRNLCVVGDDDQSIYSWRGADVSNILDFPGFFPGAKVIRLEQNYRSTERILSAANAVISGNTQRHSKKLWSDLGEGDPVTVVRTESGDAEASFIASAILQEMQDHPDRKYSDFAILYRSNHLSRELETALRQASVPYRLVGGQEFYKRKEVKDAIAYLNLLVNPRDDQSLLRILAVPPRGLAQKAVDLLKMHRQTRQQPMSLALSEPEFQQQLGGKAGASAQELASVIRRYREIFRTPGNLTTQVREYLEAVGYLGGLQRIYKDAKDADKRRDNIYEFISAIRAYEHKKGEPATLEECLESFALLEENDRTAETPENTDAVTLSTVHAAKGLEYPVVFVVAMENGVFPNERAVEEGSVEEERRLMYVAVTRAREKLFLTRAITRITRGSFMRHLASPFLDELPAREINNARPEDILRPVSMEELERQFAEIFESLRK
ncbi:MAG: UvrD-helicase domain-containing protein [Lentisphaeria bacterium]|nr:UvrD-helicase domain-containing protein [Lentisphaeria bacterium]